jgi:hypothetical protein
MKLRLLAFAIAGILAAAPCRAAEMKVVPDGGMTIEEVAAWLQNAGYKAEIKKADKGDSYITSGAEGVNFDIYLDDCKAKRCGSLEFTAGFTVDGGLKGGTAKVNEWNRDKRWVRAYLDKDNDPWAEMDISLTPGRTFAAIDDDFSIWRTMLDAFKTFIDW